MLLNEICLFFSIVLIFSLGAICGARMVYRFRHVTTKALHQSLLNALRLRGLEQNSGPSDNEPLLFVLEDD